MRLPTGVAAAASALAALLLIPAPAFADGPPSLQIRLDQTTEIGVSPNPITPTFVVYNSNSGSEATGITLTVSLADLTGGVRLDGIDPSCTRADPATVRCTVHNLDSLHDYVAYTTPVRLVAPDATAVAPAGTITVTVDSTQGGGSTRTYPVHTVPRGTDVELTTENPLPSDTQYTYLPLTMVNHGLARERTKQLVISVPEGIGFTDLDRDPNCRYLGGTIIKYWRWGPFTVVCPLVVDIEPGRSYEIIEGGSSGPRFYLVVNQITPGPFTYRGKARIDIVNPDDNPANNTATFSVDAPANKIDVAVKTRTTRDSVTWTATDKGPSAATAWTADLVAPAGTTFRRTPDCQAPTATTLHCTSTAFVAPGDSVSRTVRLDGTPTAGATGSVTISGTGPSTETVPANNKATFTLASGSGSGSGNGSGGEGGGGLPITGPSAVRYALIALGVVLLGVVLLFVGRRRSAAGTDAR